MQNLTDILVVKGGRAGSLGLVDGAFEFLLQLFHVTYGGVVLGRRLLVHQLTPSLGVLRLIHLGQPITARDVTPSLLPP